MLRGLISLALSLTVAATVHADLFLSTGNNSTSLTTLTKTLSDLTHSTTHSLCFAYSTEGLHALTKDSDHCTQGIVVYGAAFNHYHISAFKTPVLVIGGTRDGVSPISQVSHYY
jgi:hypothetical protein